MMELYQIWFLLASCIFGTTASVQKNMPHNFSFASTFLSLGVYKIEDYLVEADEEGNAAEVLIIIWPDICGYKVD